MAQIEMILKDGEVNKWKQIKADSAYAVLQTIWPNRYTAELEKRANSKMARLKQMVTEECYEQVESEYRKWEKTITYESSKIDSIQRMIVNVTTNPSDRDMHLFILRRSYNQDTDPDIRAKLHEYAKAIRCNWNNFNQTGSSIKR
jgi:LPS O-antigen subunit length determinant protein (WzzB/FepE family)